MDEKKSGRVFLKPLECTVETNNVAVKRRHRRGQIEGKSPSKGYHFEEIEGTDFSRETGHMVSIFQRIDRITRTYTKKVIDLVTGQVLKDQSHALEDHVGYGDAKRRDLE
jgi:hypothetical protein